MKKKLIAHAAAIALFFTTAFCGIGAPVHATETSGENLPEITEAEYEFYRDPETGHIGVVEDDISAYSDDADTDVSPNKALPSAYGSFNTIKNTYPCTRNQNPYGTCWAFAATACAEFDLVKNHGKPQSTDLSELQLAWFNYHTGYKTLDLAGDEVWIPSGGKHYLNMGGNLVYSMHTLAQWKCYTTESGMPYTNVTSNSSYEVPAYKSLYHDGAQLRNVRYLDIKNDPASVKEAIREYGAVYISYYHDSNYYSLNNYSLYYNPNSDAGTNHDVVIVGWDDSIPASKFPAGKRPSRNGAWLVRNSWSTNQSVGSEYTYFYMSYDDATLASTAYALDFEPGSQYDNIHQHDGSTVHSYVYTNSVANVYTAAISDYATSQKLESVMIPFTGDTNVNYKVEIYTGLPEGTANPKNGYLNSSATTTGWTSSRGIYTIDLKNPVYLYPGERFSIVVTALNGTANFDIESSSAVTYYENGSLVPWFSTTASVAKGESFVYSNGAYVDAVAYNDTYYQFTSNKTGNVCLKGVSSNNSAKKYAVTYNLNGGTNSTANPSGFLSTQSGSFTLKNPTRSGYHFLGWYSDSGFTNKVTSINYNNKSNQTLYAKWCSNSNSSKTAIISRATLSSDGSYKVTCSGCNQVKGTYTIYKPVSIKLSSSKLVYNGENRSPYPVIKDSKGNTLKNGTDYTYKYSKSTRKNTGRYSVTITFKGKYSGSKKLYFTIVPKAPSSASAKLYGYDDIKVSWSKCTGASGYYVYYKKSTASSYSNYKRTSNLYVKFSNLSDNVKYNFKIVPYYKSGDTRYKSSKYKVVSTTTLKKLAQPSMSKVSGGRVSLNWQTISGASGYQVYWASSKNGKYKKLCDYSKDYIGVTFSVGSGKTYWYKTRAYKKVDGKKIYGPFSTPKSFKR